MTAAGGGFAYYDPLAARIQSLHSSARLWSTLGNSQVGKASDFDSVYRRFESYFPSQRIRPVKQRDVKDGSTYFSVSGIRNDVQFKGILQIHQVAPDTVGRDRTGNQRD